ncbi:hypothetical protein [Niabella ginsengisoli]|uniref:DNA translocase FtsK n=1 Tax=Niabella ginsengisoli TaxID=522298 RepID=A0ABS9SRJ7_9BACT|nr:hypothetical protein [Niabella ginsengisoli]MCH5600876.1 hypothetical protein [Niabella ginsengisoli]
MKLNAAPAAKATDNEVSTPVTTETVAIEPQPQAVIELKPDPMAPKLVDDVSFIDVPMPTVEDVVKESKTHSFLLSPETEELKFVKDVENFEREVVVEDKAADVFYSPAIPGERIMEHSNQSGQQEAESEEEKEEPVKSYLSKPANIYAEAKAEEPAAQKKESYVEKKEISRDQFSVYEKSETVEKTTISFSAIEKETEVEPTIDALTHAFEEEELQKRRQLERIQKLRNLSFNVNSNDPSDEFENVPAYIRRNMELKNNTSHIESYYSKFEISSDDQNHGQINTINTFLDGKKPD